MTFQVSLLCRDPWFGPSLSQTCAFTRHSPKVADSRQNMCAFLSRPHQANPHRFEKRNLCRADISSTATVRAGRLSNAFCSPRKLPQHVGRNSSGTGFSCFRISELPNPSLSSFVSRSLENWGIDFVLADSMATFSTSDLPLRSTERSSVYHFLSGILNDITPVDAISFTLVSTVLGIMATYIVREVKDHKESPSLGRLESNPRVLNVSSPLRTYGETGASDIWLNLSRPSPFFRSVCARCPSLVSSSFYRYVQTLKSKKPDYQRKCLLAPDGGSVALDWPAHLDIGGSKELENIMLLVCGTTEGSNEDGIRKFSQMVEQHGYFPIVFNPRGCGGSPLTIPRVFSAADSDDVRLAVQFIAKSRPWATILSVGWGLGANLLARYLGEEGSYTPLTAAVCIDNPFDLSAVTQTMSGSRWLDFDNALCKGLVQILDSSKILFQGETQGFDVRGALAATSLRDFDRAISRVVHGYTTVEDFYANTSSGATLEGVQIPLLCIQHLEDYTRTQATIPHEVLDRNVYTMLVVSRPSDSKDEHPGAASEWTHAISLEWLTAVEISILKGRHPQLNEFSPTIKLPREWSNAENQNSGASFDTMDRDVVLTVPSGTSDNSSHKEVTRNESDMHTYGNRDSSNSHLQAREQNEESTGRGPSKASEGEGGKASESPGNFEESPQRDQQLEGEELTEAEEAERGQVVQVAETVMNVMDVTMPGTLADAQKQQVLNAVGRGETIVTALEEAVPEDVRGTMSAAVSEVVLAQGLSPKMAGGQTPSPILPTGVIDSIQGKLAELSVKKEAPKSEVDVSLRSGNEISNEREISGNMAQSDDPTKEITPGKSDKDIKEENPASKDEAKDSEKGMVATKIDEHSEPSKIAEVSSKDSMEQLDTDHKSAGGNKGSGDAFPKASSSFEDQTHDQGNQSQNTKEQPRGSAKNTVEERKEASSGENSGVTSRSDNPSKKIDGGESSSSEKMDTKSQADAEEVRGGSVTEKNAKMPKDVETKGEVTVPTSKSDLRKPQSDASNSGTSGVAPSAEPPSVHVPNSDPPSAEVRAGNSNPPPQKSPTSGSQASAPSSTEVPPDTSNSPLPRFQESPRDPAISEVSSDASSSPPTSPLPSQSNPRDTETSATSPSPPENPAPTAPQNPPPQSPPVPTAPQNPPSQSPPVPTAPQNPPPQSPPVPTAPQNPPPQSPPVPTAPQNPPPQSPPVPLPSIGEAVQALTGFDDSTQMAVTNVFGVVETMLDQLEKESSVTDASSGKKSAEEVLNQAPVEMKTELEQNAPDDSELHDEDVNDQGTDDKKPKESALVATNMQKRPLQSFAEKKQESIKAKSTGLSGAVELADPGNGSSRVSAGSRGVKPYLSTNERGYITDALGQSTRLESHEPEEYQQNPQSNIFLSNNSPNSLDEAPAQDIVDDQFLEESATERKLQVLADEIDAEGEETAKHSASDKVTAANSVTAVQQDDGSMVTDLVMSALKLEVVRRLGAAGLEAVGVDLETEVARVAQAVSEVVTMGKNKLLGGGSHETKSSQGLDSNLGGKLRVLNGNSIVTALGSVLGSNSLLGRLLPFGVLAGVVMAALGATYVIVSDDQEEESAQIERSSSRIKGDMNVSSPPGGGSHPANYHGESDDESSEELGDVLDGLRQDGTERSTSSENSEEWNVVDAVSGSAAPGYVDGEEKSTEQTAESKPPHEGKLMGAMAAAMGATAAVASTATSTSEGDAKGSEGGEQMLVPGIAEKAISIVSPVVPRTEAGELDQERLVAVFTELGQRGGPLTLVGKVALLWGGLRGAMSLADRLLAFFRIKDRPLHERLLGFGGMAVILWTPVLVPLLPTLLQQWATKSPSGVADAAAGIGLYGAIFILVTIWGRRVRGYDRPLVSYGLHLFSRAKLRLFAGGLAIGVGLVSGYHGMNWVLGYSQFRWDAVVVSNSNFPGALASTILTSWKVLMLVTQSLAMAVAVALVEEVLFRAWLQEEIAVDLGYHWAVLLSALAFAAVHRSPAAIVGLWFLAVALAGARARTDGDLSFPIGIHGGLVSAFSVMNLRGLVRYIPESPSWVTGVYAGNPLAGALGIGMVAALAVALYPRQQDKFRDRT